MKIVARLCYVPLLGKSRRYILRVFVSYSLLSLHYPVTLFRDGARF